MPDVAAMPLATVRDSAASFVLSLTSIYVMLLFLAVLISLYQQIGGRIPYSSAARAVLDFVESLTAPVFQFFRRFVPMIGMFDLSPIVAMVLIGFGGRIVAGLIAG
jgi:YggT family protein